MASTSLPSPEQIQKLRQYTACDIADALLKLNVPNAGFIPDLILQSPWPQPSDSNNITIAPASTVLFTSKAGDVATEAPSSGIPAGKHWVDLTHSGTIVVMSQPAGQNCSVLGGIMALRMKKLGAKGVVVCGRCRDIMELRDTGLPIWSKGRSIVGSNAEAKPYQVQVSLNIDGTIINPGDLVFSDAVNGVAIIPKDKIGEVSSLVSRLVEVDETIKEEVGLGMTVQQAFQIYRH